jgi:hypothetical protein
MFKIYIFMFGLNNGILSSVRAMPRKDLNSDNESTFAIPRRTYTSTVTPTGDEKKVKKWFGNRDASQVTAKNRVNEIGVGSLNAANAPMAFKDTLGLNTRRQALRRVRHNGQFL